MLVSAYDEPDILREPILPHRRSFLYMFRTNNSNTTISAIKGHAHIVFKTKYTEHAKLMFNIVFLALIQDYC